MSHREETSGEDPGHAGETMSLGWPGNASRGPPGRAGGSVWVSTVGAIIRKWKKHHLIINRPRTGAPRKVSDQGVRKMVRRVLKEPRTTRKALQKDMEAAGTSAFVSAIGARWQNKAACLECLQSDLRRLSH
ncbi:hypothetical protein L3Q82_000256 [Scortum barcoo]|uniref:Uncharacterized protein n=1 Tax=Scortum barcoo TaxID=214431 RepID=A0ACB8X9N3_9TELE|nr:hypothetical protein L3Q82_000256 [Scortum barcoo]